MPGKHAPDVRTVSYWAQRWTDGYTGWHQAAPDQDLAANTDLLLPPPGKYRVFVPLCGKSLDLMWLYQAGHTVVGVEGVTEVVEQFYTEHSLAYTTTALPWATRYQSTDGRMTIFVCDLFSVSVEDLGTFDAVYDRGSLVAINVCDRQRYAGLLKRLLRPTYRYLLSTVEYLPTETFAGPPCSISNADVEALFGVTVQEMGSKDRKERYAALLAGGEMVAKCLFFTAL